MIKNIFHNHQQIKYNMTIESDGKKDGKIECNIKDIFTKKVI